MMVDPGLVLGRARWVRARAGLLGGPPPYSTQQIVDAVFPDLVVTGADLPSRVVELVDVTAGRRTLFYSRAVAAPTQRVGIAHGLYHLVLAGKGEQDGTMAECNTGLRELERRGKISRDPVEVACDLFAGELLVPFDALDEVAPVTLFPRTPDARHVFDDEVDRLASLFNVPAGFLRWRLFDLGHLRKTHFWGA